MMAEEADRYIEWGERLTILEGAIESLKTQLDELGDVESLVNTKLQAFKESLLFNELQDVSDSLSQLQAHLLDVRRLATAIDMRETANTLRSYLRDAAQSEETAPQAVTCVDYLDRQYATFRTEVKYSDEPEGLKEAFLNKLTAYLGDRGFKPFIEW